MVTVTSIETCPRSLVGKACQRPRCICRRPILSGAQRIGDAIYVRLDKPVSTSELYPLTAAAHQNGFVVQVGVINEALGLWITKDGVRV